MKQHERACSTCPWSRTTPSSEVNKIGGTRAVVYLAQAIGPFFLPCHATPGYKGNATQFKGRGCGGECAGAAIMRANLGVGKLMPYDLLALPGLSDPNVFRFAAEFLRHHCPAFPQEMVLLIVRKLHVFRRRQMRRQRDRMKP